MINRKVIPTDQEQAEWTNKTGKKIIMTTEAVRIRNISLKQVNSNFINASFITNERDGLNTIRSNFDSQEWIPYYSFAMDRVLNSNTRKNLLLAQKTKTGKYVSFYEEHINQQDTDFATQKEKAEKICPNKQVLAVLDPAEFDPINLGRKAKWLLDRGEKECIVRFRGLKYIDGWEAIQSIINDKMRLIVTDIKPIKTIDAGKYSNLVLPFFFSENIIVSHGRGRSFGSSSKNITWLNNHFSYKKNKLLENKVPKTTAYHHSRIYSINKAIRNVATNFQIKDIVSLSNNIDGVRYFAKQLGLIQ